jgi:glycosyltransferase involved in cell wall biosynthesis
VGTLEEVGLPEREQVGAQGVLAARLGRELPAGQDVEHDLGLELGSEPPSLPHRGVPPIEPVRSLCTWSDLWGARQAKLASVSRSADCGVDQPLVLTEATSLRVVILDEELPYPANSGKRIRTLQLIRRLAPRHKIIYVAHRNADAREARQAVDYLEGLGIEPIVVERRVPPKVGPRFFFRLALNLTSGWPYSVVSHYSPAMRQAVGRLEAAHAIDLWQAEWTPYAAYFCKSSFRTRSTLIMAHNVESQIWRRYEEHAPSGPRRYYIRNQRCKVERFESAALATVSRVVAVSDVDAVRIRTEFSAPSVSVIENGVDLDEFYPSNRTRDPRTILFLGSLDWRPNLDAATRLLQQIFPEVRRVLPDARLWLVGRNPPRALVRTTAKVSGVELHANVRDTRPFLWSCGVMVVPLRIGGGTRLKILEALATETPVVSTSVGVEGLALEPGRDLLVHDSVDGMVRALIDVLREPAMGQALARRGREVVKHRYDWNTLAERLERVWLDCTRVRS